MEGERGRGRRGGGGGKGGWEVLLAFVLNRPQSEGEGEGGITHAWLQLKAHFQKTE